MTISLITPTSDRPAAWPLLERYIARQTVQPDQWLVVDDGRTPAPLTMGQDHLRLSSIYVTQRSLAKNLMAGLKRVTGDIIFIIEDDDWYAPEHIEVAVESLETLGVRATGCIYQNYYNVYYRSWRSFRNTCGNLCSTAFVKAAVPDMMKAAQEAFNDNHKGIDARFWARIGRSGYIHTFLTMYGIKGLPGRPGIGIGHEPPNRYWTADPELRKLREWIGDDAALYEGYRQ